MKLSSRHTTMIPVAKLLVRYLATYDGVKKVSIGIIKAFPGRRKSTKRVVKIKKEGAAYKVQLTEGSTHQIIRFYLHADADQQAITKGIAGWVLSNGWEWRV